MFASNTSVGLQNHRILDMIDEMLVLCPIRNLHKKCLRRDPHAPLEIRSWYFILKLLLRQDISYFKETPGLLKSRSQ